MTSRGLAATLSFYKFVVVKTLIAILGPTASGKTGLSVELAKLLNTEIVSCDSRQFFKEMSIGTAKPTAEEMGDVVHHLIGHLSIHDPYTVGTFETEALSTLEHCFQASDHAVLVGGSGLYARTLFYGIDSIPSDPQIRQQLTERLTEQGLDSLVEELLKLDPESTKMVDLQNPQRVMRALEACLASGLPYSTQRSQPKAQRPFRIVKIALNWEREQLYQRINQRVDQMMDNGLLEEVRSLHPHRALNALQTVGYKELFEHLDGNISLEEAVELIKRNTRRFAKRQMTWFRKEPEIHWIDISPTTTTEALIQQILPLCTN